MKHGQNNRRQRSRGNNNRRYPNQRGNSFESNGPEVKVRGTAQQVLEKYQSLARDAFSSGDRVLAEGYLQHAEHYYRVMNADNEGQNRNRQNRNNRDDENESNEENDENNENKSAESENSQPKNDRSDNSKSDKSKKIEITTPSDDEKTNTDVAATAETAANDVVSKDQPPKKPRTRRPRKTEASSEPADQSQAAD